MIYEHRKLDRLPQFDARSRLFSAAPLTQGKPPRSYTWRVPVWLDQGYEGACVGFSWAQELAARPVEVVGVGANFARDIYRSAQRIDPWEGEDYEGTSVLAGAQVVKSMGYIGEYRWAFTLEDALSTISRHGPAIFGTNWYDGMFDTDAHGFLNPTGDFVGGHAIVINGVNVKNRLIRLHNSWGKNWGVNGEAFMTWDAFDHLRLQQGEVCIPVLRSKG